MIYDKHTDCCNFNVWVQCENKQCENCGWNPEVAQRRKESIYARHRELNGKTKVRKVHGLNCNLEKADYTPTIITVRVTTDDYGSSLSLCDENKNVMLMIPLEAIPDMMKAVEVKNA